MGGDASPGVVQLSRPFAAGAFAFRLQCSSRHLCRTVEALLIDLPAPGTDDRDVTTLTLHHENDSPLVQLSGSGELDVGPLHLDGLFDVLVPRIGRLSLDAEPERLHFHGATVAFGERATLITAPAETGKSVLTVALVQRGARYMSDEMLVVSSDGSTLGAFPKPVTIKASGTHLFPELSRHRVELVAAEHASWYVPVSRFADTPLQAATPSLIVFLHRAQRTDPVTGTPQARLVHRSDAVVALMQQGLDIERFGPSALEVVARLVTRCRTVRVDAGAPDATAALVEQLQSHRSDAPVAPRRLHEDRNQTFAPHVSVPESVVSLVVDGRAVLHDRHTGNIASLDAGGSAVWLALHGESTEDVLPRPDADEVVGFFGELARTGFIMSDVDTRAGAGGAR